MPRGRRETGHTRPRSRHRGQERATYHPHDITGGLENWLPFHRPRSISAWRSRKPGSPSRSGAVRLGEGRTATRRSSSRRSTTAALVSCPSPRTRPPARRLDRRLLPLAQKGQRNRELRREWDHGHVCRRAHPGADHDGRHRRLRHDPPALRALRGERPRLAGPAHDWRREVVAGQPG